MPLEPNRVANAKTLIQYQVSFSIGYHIIDIDRGYRRR